MYSVGELLKEDFGATVVLGGEEYDNFPAWKQLVADHLLEVTLSYRIMKINVVSATKKTDQYNKAVNDFVSGKITMMPLWAKPGNTEEILLAYQLLREEIRRLISVYNAV